MWEDAKLNKSIEIFLIFSLTLLALFTRFTQLGYLGLWGDEGFTYLAVEGILEHGTPLLPSGHLYLKDVLFSYFSSIVPFFFGLNEFTLRFTNALFGVALIPLVYCVGKRFLSAPFAFLVALLLTLSHWEIEFARHARYYCQLQFFYLLSLSFFYSAFVQERKGHGWFALLFFVFAALTHQLAYSLILAFPLLLWVKGPRVLMEKRILFFGILFAAVAGFLQFFEIYFWEVGSVSHLEKGSSFFKTLIQDFNFRYFKQFQWLFPSMSWVALFGGVVWFIRRKTLLSFFVGMGFLTITLMSLGKAHFQPRYVFFLYPLFLFAYVGGLYFLYQMVLKIFDYWVIKGGKIVGAILVLPILIFTIDASNPKYSLSLYKHAYGERLIEKFQPSTTFRYRIDYKTPAQYVRARAMPEDLILGMHMIYQYIYAWRCDYWLWSAGRGAWDAFEEYPEGTKDRYLGIPLIRNLAQFEAFLDENTNKQVWVITTPSMEDRGHIEPALSQYLKDHPESIQYRSPDGVSKVYLF